MRRIFLQIHRWIGLLTGLYIVVVSLTGVVLVWRIDLQRLSYPELFTPTRPEAIVDAETVLASVRAAYPLHRVSGVDAPTTSRPTYLAYVTRGNDFVTILADPATGRVLGELPDAGAIRLLQDVHFNLLGGRRGRLANGVGAAALLTMCATGLVIWWPSPRQWARAFVVDVRRPWRIVIRDLHGAAGIWSVAFLAMWALTGAAFAFPSAFRSLVGSLSPLTTPRPPVSGSPRGRSPLSWGDLIAKAQRQAPDQHIARVVIPSSDTSAFLVMFSPSVTRAAGADLTSIYLDQYSGDVLPESTNAQRTAGDIVMAWLAPLHVGNFSGTATKITWTLLALAPTALFVSGVVMWATKIKPRRTRRSRSSGHEGHEDHEDQRPLTQEAGRE